MLRMEFLRPTGVWCQSEVGRPGCAFWAGATSLRGPGSRAAHRALPRRVAALPGVDPCRADRPNKPNTLQRSAQPLSQEASTASRGRNGRSIAFRELLHIGVQRRTGDPHERANLLNGALARAVELHRVAALVLAEPLAETADTPASRVKPSARPFTDQRPFELRQRPEDVEHELTGAGVSVDRLLQAAQPDALRAQRLGVRDEVVQRPAQPVEPPHRQRVAGTELGQRRPPCPRRCARTQPSAARAAAGRDSGPRWRRARSRSTLVFSDLAQVLSAPATERAAHRQSKRTHPNPSASAAPEENLYQTANYVVLHPRVGPRTAKPRPLTRYAEGCRDTAIPPTRSEPKSSRGAAVGQSKLRVALLTVPGTMRGAFRSQCHNALRPCQTRSPRLIEPPRISTRPDGMSSRD